PSAIVKAGLRIRLVDIDPRTLDYNYSQLEGVDSKDGLAVMACNLFGILSDMHKLERIAGENQLYLIDDAAQSMGSRHGSKYSGTFGDAGIFSLGRGKNMTAYEGGVLVTNNDRIAGKIDDSITELAKPSIKAEIKAFSNLLFYSLFLRPRLYWIPARIPFLHLGETVFDPDFKLSQLSGIQKSVSALMFNELSGINSIRKKNALAIGQALIDNGSYMIPGYTESNCPAYIRLPVICPNNSWRDRAIQKLVSRGINATIMYPCGIHQIPGIREHLGPDCGHFPGAEMVADRLLTIPTHPYLKQTHIETIISTLAEMK
ncbi:MAG TPA: hypothetical protein ENO07_00540, partial [candidate division Zixibacteria bacterium]|nr:hypothetical protein [candidate division Zixibacteria bacterium]